MKIFITGATGFLGHYLVKELSPKFETLYILTRNIDFQGFHHFKNIKLIKGDITSLSIIENINEREEVIGECDFVIHAAALYDMTAGHTECYMQNVVGTQNMLNFVEKMRKIKSFYYVSTIAVGDDQTFFLEEDYFPARKKFNDNYSETKYLAEKIVREHSQSKEVFPPVRIIRPGIIVGDSENGRRDKTNGIYYFIEAFKKNSQLIKTLPVLPLSFNPRTKIPIIPVNHCARFISLLIERDNGDRKLKTYHLVSDQIPTAKEFLNDINEVLGLSTQYIPIGKNIIHNYLLNILGIPTQVIPFMFSKLSYDKTRTIEELPELKTSKYDTYKSTLFS